MLGEYGIWLLGIMGHVYFGGAVICVWALVKCVSNKLAGQAVISLISVVAITITSLICVLPFLKMHGSYSDKDRLLIMALVAANIALIIFVSLSRIRLITGINAGLASLAGQAGQGRAESTAISERGIKHRRIIGYIWLALGGAWLALSSYSILRILLTTSQPEKALGLITAVTVSLLFITGGYSLLRGLPWSRWLCLPASVLALMSFPVGTIPGGYYLWYYLTIEKQSSNSPAIAQ